MRKERRVVANVRPLQGMEEMGTFTVPWEGGHGDPGHFLGAAGRLCTVSLSEENVKTAGNLGGLEARGQVGPALQRAPPSSMRRWGDRGSQQGASPGFFPVNKGAWTQASAHGSRREYTGKGTVMEKAGTRLRQLTGTGEEAGRGVKRDSLVGDLSQGW